MTQLSRRRFLQQGAALPAVLCAPALLRSRAPSETIRVAAIGFHGRGADLIGGVRAVPGVQIVALCDVDADVLGGMKAQFESRGEKVDAVKDARSIFDRKDVDAVVIATPNHWHSLLSIWACQAGKDVYVEKPVSHNVFEGRQLVKAARRHGRIVQCGTQSRSSEGIAEGIAYLRSGALGKIKVARGFCYKPRQSIGKVTAPTPIPATIDYDLWCGPAPNDPLRRAHLHYDWHWLFATGNGDLGNQGIHQMDQCRWALGESGLPRRVASFGGRVGYDDDGDTANTQVVILDYEAAPLVFEVRGLPHDKAAQAANWGGSMDEYSGVRIGAVIECEGGSLRIPDYTQAIAIDAAGKETKRFQGASDHVANFFAAVRSRKAADLKAEIEEGHVSSALCHLGNVSYRLAPKQADSAGRDAVAALPFAGEALERCVDHLAKNEVKPDGLRFGPVLEFDPVAERFAAANGNALLRREYRAPFVVPDEV